MSQSEKVSPDFTIVPSRVLQAKFIFEYLALVSLGSLVEKLEIVLFFEDLFCFFSFDGLVLLEIKLSLKLLEVRFSWEVDVLSAI